jgi:nucleoside-diphosphate-sugar epimerase
VTVLVTGARGNIGRHVVAELLARHIPGVRTLTRQGLPAEPARPLESARASGSPYPTSLPTAARQGRDATGVSWPSGLVEVVEGDLARSATVDHLLGQRPRTFAQWAAEHAAAFR